MTAVSFRGLFLRSEQRHHDAIKLLPGLRRPGTAGEAPFTFRLQGATLVAGRRTRLRVRQNHVAARKTDPMSDKAPSLNRRRRGGLRGPIVLCAARTVHG
jgi:hypothetical protein